MSRPLSQIRARMQDVVSSIRRRAAVRWWYRVGFVLLSISLFGAAKFDSLSEARGAIRHYSTRARAALVMAPPDTLVVFGPKQFVTAKSNTQINFVESFSVPPAIVDTGWAPARNQYTIRLQRVGGSLATATVAVNGTTVATAADFSTATYIERIITVNEASGNANSLTVTLKGAAAAGLTVKIVGVPDGTFPIFGPKVYSKGSTTPSHYTETFTLPAGAFAPYAISARASVAGTKATIGVNGVQVIKDADFGTNVTYVVRQSLLSGTNTMSVDVRGTTGTTITVTVLATDKTPPTLTIAAPAPNFVTNATTVTVSGTSMDREPTQVKVNSVVATMSGTQYSATVPLVVGTNAIAIQATDKAGNRVDSARTVIRDSLPPTLNITSPADSSYTSLDYVTVAGTFSDPSPVTIRANGVFISQSSPFSAAYSGITPGTNFVTITATDAGGNVTSQVRKVTQVKEPPVLTVTAPTSGQLGDGTFGFYTNITPLQISGTATGAAPMTVTVNGVAMSLNDGVFSGSVPLTEGWNSLTVTATGPSGLVRQQVVGGRLNTSPPDFYIDMPRDVDGQTTAPFTNASPTVFIIYPANNPFTPFPYISATMNGVTLTIDSTGRFSGPVPLVEGKNAVTAMVTDNAGRVGVVTDTMYLDTQPPVIELTSPAAGAHFVAQPLVVSGTIDWSYGQKRWLTVNGVDVDFEAVSEDMPWRFSTQVPLDSGVNTISIVVRELAGNTTTLTRTVTFGEPLDDVPPDPATIAPPLDATVATTTFAATSFLYTGPNPIQTGVVAGTIQPLQAAVIRGMVRARTGEALPAVKVTVLDHPEFGQTLSRADGAFDLVVNGGEPLTLNYQKTGFLPAQRQAPALWQDYLVLDPVTLVSLDPLVTTVDFSQPAQVARGGVVTDESGTRQATMIFKGGTQASLRMPDGTTQPLTSIAVRATEYTVGPTGPSAMPAPLPATSAYTYAVELSADEAIAAGATSVLFDRPVALYVDNFLSFPIGKPVPVGIYDRVAAQWVASPNGRIVKVLQVADGRASLDVDGSGSEATAEALAALGVDEAELNKLGALYAPGKSLWRVQLSHFTPCDLNWPPDRDTTSKRPTVPNPDEKKAPVKGCKARGSVIGCERQTLGESIALAGTSLRLNYQSDGSPAYKEAYSTDISLIGDTIPLNLQRIELEVRIAGRLFTQTFTAQRNQSTRFVWDGNDSYGRPIQGAQLARIRIGYTYPAPMYANVIYEDLNGSFGSYGNSPLTVDRSRWEATLWQDMSLMLGTSNTRSEGLGGWSLDVHHYYDPMGQILRLGDGSRRSAADLANAATTIAGTDPVAPGCPFDCANKAKAGDRAVDAFFGIQGIGVARDGTMHVADARNLKIWRVNTAGILEHVAGTGTNGFSGDSIPAISASIEPSTLQVGPDNSVYFADFGGPAAGSRIRRIDRDGIITTVAGTGVCGDSLPAGTLANQANLCFNNFTVAKDGAVFVTDRTEVFRVGADGILTRIVGDGSYVRCPSGTRSSTCAEGKSANAHGAFHRLDNIAVGADGSLYLANREFRVLRAMIIYRIGPDGIIRRFAGTGDDFGLLGNGTPATSVAIVTRDTQMGIADDGTLYFTEDIGVVAQVDHAGRVHLVAGCTGSQVSCGRNSGRRATNTTLAFPSVLGNLTFGPDGRLYFADDYIARRVAAPLPALGIHVSTVAAEDGSQLFVFAPDGKHLRTLDALLGNTVHEFGYDAAGLLSTITDGDGNVVMVERDGAGALTAIVAPFGQRTELTLNSAKYLTSVTRPGEPATVLTYDADGLLKTFTDGNGSLHQFTYDDKGLLVRDDDPAGGFKTLVRSVTDSSSAVTVTTALGNSISYGTSNLSTGVTRRTTIDGAGLASTATSQTNGTVSLTSTDSTVTTVSTGPDPRFGMQAPVLSQVTTRTPSGLLSTVTAGRRTILSDPANLLSLVSQYDSLVVNGRVFRNTYIAATKTSTAVSPMGRSTTARVDAFGRVVEQATPEITPVQYQYDPRGRLSQVAQDTLRWTYSYNSQGRLATATDPLTRSSQFFYDAADRLTRQVLTDGREVLYGYDSIGNLRSVTPPGRPAHRFQHNAVDLVTSYDPPTLGAGSWSTTYQYDVDRKLTQIARPAGQTIGFGYDAAGRPGTVTVPGGAIQYTYHSGTGNLTGVTGAYGGSLAFSYDGTLPTGVTWAGEVSGTVAATYNNNFQVTGLGVNGGPAVTLAYDNDGLLSQAGALTITRNAANGLITGTVLGSVTTSHSYTPLGALDRLSASVSGTTVFDVTYTRDVLGRLKELTEALGGTTTTKAFTYDLTGRLTEVRENGALAAVYDYDSSGNRLRATRPGGVENGAHDAQDRLMSYGTATFGYTDGGELKFKAVGTDTTRYLYDALGNLREVQLVDGTQIKYMVDAFNRRIGKKVNGILVQGFLYQSQLSPVAELDGAGNVVSRFVYGARGNVPSYLVKAGVTFAIVADHLGSVRLVVNTSTGSVVQRIDYDEFGRVTQNTNPGFQPFGFAGGLLDAHTSLVRFGARDYDAQIGRWTAKDPIGFEGGDTQFYAYVRNDPINAVDPTGQTPWDILDLGFFAESLYKFLSCPGWGRAGDLFLNGLGLLPGVPSLGLIRKLDDLGDAAKSVAPQIAKIENQLAQHGRGSVEKSLRSLEGRLGEHRKALETYREQGGYTSSVEREIRAFEAEIEAIKQVLGRGR